MTIKIVTVGKVKEKSYLERILEYIKWINNDVRIELIIIKDNTEKVVNAKLNRYFNSNNYKVCVTEEGKQFSSKMFSEFIFKKAQNIIFFIGGPDGHSPIIRQKSNQLLSLSKMTLPHEMALMILTEQIFRAISIKKGSKYHRE
tara:strand:+ start:71 stop:502 length:432 start_codon:yes stop_codon:yes gene_type:complete